MGWLALTLALGATACRRETTTTNTGSEPKQELKQLGETCSATELCEPRADCLTLAGHELTWSVCSKPCATQADCTGGTVCGTADDGSAMCLLPCERHASNLACVDGLPVGCTAAGDTYCEECGCPADQLCVPGTGCVLKAEVGAPCSEDEACASDNCSLKSNTCRVPVGTACTWENCDECLTKDNWSYCSRECTSARGCGDGLCVQWHDDIYKCKPACESANSTCVGTCKPVIGGEYYCDCECPYQEEPRPPLGSLCKSPVECASDDCYQLTTGGFCSRSCILSSQCGDGFACLDIPCKPKESPATCGKRCLPTCDATTDCQTGTCRRATTIEEDMVEVCDVKLPEGAACDSVFACQSGDCCASGTKMGTCSTSCE